MSNILLLKIQERKIIRIVRLKARFKVLMKYVSQRHHAVDEIPSTVHICRVYRVLYMQREELYIHLGT